MKNKKVRVLLIMIFVMFNIFDLCSCNVTMNKKEKEPQLEPVDQKRSEIERYQNLVAIGGGHMLGLKSDGTVVVTGINDLGQCETEGWSDIVDIATGDEHDVGLNPMGE